MCRPILYHGFPIQSKSIVKLLRQKTTVTTLKLFHHKEFIFNHEKEGRGLTSSTSPYHAETNYINDKCRPRSSGNVTETRFCSPGNTIFIDWKIPKIKTLFNFTIVNRDFTWLTREFPSSIPALKFYLSCSRREILIENKLQGREGRLMLSCTKYRMIRRNFCFLFPSCPEKKRDEIACNHDLMDSQSK